MNIILRYGVIATWYMIMCFSGLLFPLYSQAKDVSISVCLRGVYQSKISLLPLTGVNALKPLIVIDTIRNGETVILQVPQENLPGEFVLRFDYKEDLSSQPYPSEKQIIINNQDLELQVHPLYSNNPDSTWFQNDEKENHTYHKYMAENADRKKILGLLQNFLLYYDDPDSELYHAAIEEYEKRRKDFNRWVDSQVRKNNHLFVSNLFGFEYVPEVNWEGSEAERKVSLRDNYFEVMDLSRALLINTSALKSWMDGYVNLFGELATSIRMRDSLFTLAGKTAIEKSKTGHPLVYGWMVDYFFNGYESLNITEGIAMLQPYVDDPDCLTSKRHEIERRVKGIETLVPGTIAPNIIIQDSENKQFELNTFQGGKDYILILFWSADCSHCIETVDDLYTLYTRVEVNNLPDIIAISLDGTVTEIEKWNQKLSELKEWTHLRATEGIRSKVVEDYYILGVPVMILLKAKTREIIGMPENVDKLYEILNL